MTQNEDSSVKMYYGACYTSWRTMNVATAGEFQALDDIQGDPDSHSGTICVHLPTYKCYVSTQPRIVSLRHKFNHSLAPEATKFQVPVPYPNFCLSNSFPVVDVEVECLFRVLDTEVNDATLVARVSNAHGTEYTDCLARFILGETCCYGVQTAFVAYDRGRNLDDFIISIYMART